MGIFNTLLVQPLFNLLIFLYNVIPGLEIGLAIIALTVLVKLVLWPLTHKSLKSQKALQKIQPQLKELQTKYKDDRETLAKEMMQLYTREKVNPASSCLPIIIQLPILFALYRVLIDGLNEDSFGQLYSFVPAPEHLDVLFLGLNLAERSVLLAILAGILQWGQMKMLQSRRPPKPLREKEGAKDEDMMASMNKSMLYVMPIVTVVIGISLPGGLTLYWVAVNLISIIQQWVAFHWKSADDKDDVKPKEIEAKT